MIWFSSDWHLGHEGILIHQAPRLNAFECIEEMDAKIIEGVNAVVKPNDQLFFLGDFCWQASKAGRYRNRIKVRNMIVCRGNHDAASLRNHVSRMELMLFEKFKVNENDTIKIHLCHYPLLSWGSMHRGGYHLYGHCHGMFEDELNKLFSGRKAMDISVDYVHRLIGEWRPINLEEVLYVIEKFHSRQMRKAAQEISSYENHRHI